MDDKFFIDNLFSGIFFPRKTPIPEENKSLFRILRVKVDNETQIGGILYLHSNPTDYPTVIFFHGNGETALDYNYFVKSYIDCGVNFAMFDYRGYGFSSGIPKYTALFEDPLIIYDQFSKWIESEYSGIMASTFFVMGRSLGSACAACLGGYNPEKMKGIIFESGFGSNKRMIQLISSRYPNISPEILKPYSNDTYTSQIKKPCLVIHGRRDQIIPFVEGEYLFSSIPSNIEKKFIEIRSATHNDISSYESEYYPPIKKFIEKYK